MRKSTEKKNIVTSAIPGVPGVPAAKNYYLVRQVALSLSTCRITKHTEGCDETKRFQRERMMGLGGEGGKERAKYT